jgi:thiol:disulfide interchange protein
MLRVTAGILVLWIAWALVDAVAEDVLSFRSFGLISPLVGVVCLAVSAVALVQAIHARASKRCALVAITLSLVIAVVPFAALPFDPS